MSRGKDKHWRGKTPWATGRIYKFVSIDMRFEIKLIKHIQLGKTGCSAEEPVLCLEVTNANVRVSDPLQI